MKRILCLLVLMGLAGCTTAQIPTYLQDKNPYVKRVYASHEVVLDAVTQTLEDLGWTIEGTAHPSVYEQEEEAEEQEEQKLLIFTGIRQTPMFLGTRYAKMNVILRSQGEVSDIEIRYLTVTSVFFKNIKTYHNDSAVERIFGCIEKILNKE